MKTLFTLLVMLLSITTAMSQSTNVETQSVTLDHFIAFIAENYPLDNTNNEEEEDDETNNESFSVRHITFLLETGRRNFSSEDKIILQQAFKFLSTRLSEDDLISIVAYSGMNGQVLDYISPKKTKKIQNTISDVKSHLSGAKTDGIALAYRLAQENLSEDTYSSVVMIRNPNPSHDVGVVKEQNTTQLEVPKNNSNMVILTAIAVLPELISIIKD